MNRTELFSMVSDFVDNALHDSKEIQIDGFEHLRVAYTVTRNNVNCLVAVDSLTNEEIQSRINDLRKVGDGCHVHANELERYVEERCIEA